MFSFVTIGVAMATLVMLAGLGSYVHHQMRLRRHLNRLRMPADRWNRV